MSVMGVSEAAAYLGVNRARVHQRIADGSLRAHRLGAQWVVDEFSVLEAAERRQAGRPLSPRSAWAVLAVSRQDSDGLRWLSPPERSRARERLARLLRPAVARPDSEEAAHAIAISLRSLLRNRAERRLFRAAEADLGDLRKDRRWISLLDPAASRIASPDVEGYLHDADVERLVSDFLLIAGPENANVIVHALPAGSEGVDPRSQLCLAADLAEHRGPREEARAAELLHELAQEHERNGP